MVVKGAGLWMKKILRPRQRRHKKGRASRGSADFISASGCTLRVSSSLYREVQYFVPFTRNSASVQILHDLAILDL